MKMVKHTYSFMQQCYAPGLAFRETEHENGHKEFCYVIRRNDIDIVASKSEVILLLLLEALEKESGA